jgi:hypothetical protein
MIKMVINMAIPKVGKFSLHNGGGFVCRIMFNYMDDSGHSNTTGQSGDILLGQTKVVDPAELGVPNGSIVTLKAFVVWGTNNTAQQSFVYEKGNPAIAKYTITGTTLDNTLGLISN